MSTPLKWPIEHPDWIQLYSPATPNGHKGAVLSAGGFVSETMSISCGLV
jgi:hypothetical protein